MKYLLILMFFVASKAQAQNHMVRLAKLEIDPAQLNTYKLSNS